MKSSSELLPDDALIDNFMISQSWFIEKIESSIDQDKQLYLFTWSPTPSELPNADFICQHDFALEFVADYLSGCLIGLACVESSQRGNPHYHGWYQVSEDSYTEAKRICYVKVLQKYGLLKITKCKGYYRIGSYTSHANALYYYKKDIFGCMSYVPTNPIRAGMKSTIEPLPYWFAIEGKRHTVADLENKITNREFYRDFYRDSDPIYKK